MKNAIILAALVLLLTVAACGPTAVESEQAQDLAVPLRCLGKESQVVDIRSADFSGGVLVKNRLWIDDEKRLRALEIGRQSFVYTYKLKPPKSPLFILGIKTSHEKQDTFTHIYRYLEISEQLVPCRILRSRVKEVFENDSRFPGREIRWQ